jgi:TolA-binding protein
MLGRAQMAFAAERWGEAEKIFRKIVEQFPNSDAAPEALYWAGVAPYKASHDPASLKQTANAFRKQYQGTSWAKKASIWA